VAVTVGVVATLTLAITSCAAFEAPAGGSMPAVGTTETPGIADDYQAPSAESATALPEARYDAVIAGLMPFDQPAATQAVASYHLAADAPLYGADKTTAVARLASLNFLGQNTVVVPVEIDGPWALILTPSRQELPSQNNGDAPAQSSAWIRTSLLVKDADVPARIDVSLGQQTLTITAPGQPVASFQVGVGAPDTPTPTGVTGYIQARYLDPAQDETVYPIQLTSLHSAVADNPYRGTDGGLIGVHFEAENTGQVSHGCIRLPVDAITAVNALPLGTLITIAP
jgi:lipoprotein-anchoring transpeptidase ErfK/SrfK